jgi:hypothetical protein
MLVSSMAFATVLLLSDAINRLLYCLEKAALFQDPVM